MTGIPLPFVSVGGSALIANLLAVGVLQAIHVRGAARPQGLSLAPSVYSRQVLKPHGGGEP